MTIMGTIASRNIQPRKKPVYGVISVILPLLGIPTAVFMASHQGGEGWRGLSVLFAISSMSIFPGFFLALVSICRSEKYPILGVFGIVANVAPVLWFAYGVIGH